MTEKETAQSNVPNNALSEVDLSEEEVTQWKLTLADYELKKDDTDAQLVEYEKQLELRVPERILDESIADLKEDIANKKVRTNKEAGNEVVRDATQTDMDLMNIKLTTMLKLKELDVPMRDLRYKINSLRYSKGRFDAPEQQIKKLKKGIREKRASVPAARVRPNPAVG